MKKAKLYFIVSILIPIFLFTTAAICNQCGATPEEEAAVQEAEEDALIETEEEESEEMIEEEPEELPEEESEEEVAEDTEEEGAPPTIELQIYEGPLYSQADDICYYRVKAIVTGNPTPDVQFSKDDSGGAWGEFKAQVNLNNPADTYNLTATATNSDGTANDSINLSWGCPIPNNPPEISEITLMGNHYVGLEYTVSAAASDPDGDSLSYSWSVTGGSVANPDTNPVKWTMPNTAGNYNITVTVDDGKGGQAQKAETVEVLAMPSVNLSQIPGGGYINEGILASVTHFATVGDYVNNRPYRGFLSFDISSLAGKVVISAKMEFNQYDILNNPYSIIEKIWVESVYWGTDDIKLGDYDLPGVLLGEYDIPFFACSSQALIDALNQAINDGKDRFQIRLRHKGPQTNHNGINDQITYGGALYPVRFTVYYVP